MRVIFMGTPRIAAEILKELAREHEIACVVTQPDAVRGRGSRFVASDVAQVAEALGLTVIKPAKMDEETIECLKSLDADVACVVAFGKILPQEVLDIPPYGCLNVHASLLPRWRGAAPIERAILAGDKCVGVSIMKMDAGLDTGDYCNQRQEPIAGRDALELQDAIASLGATALLDTLYALEADCGITWISQDESQVTYAEKIGKGELNLDPYLSSVINERHVRASSEAHPSRAIVAGRYCTIEKAKAIVECELDSENVRPGMIVWRNKKLFLTCADGFLEVLHVKPDGKKSMDAKAFAAGIQGIKSGNLSWEKE